MPSRLAAPAILAAVLLLLPARAGAQAAPDPRPDLEAVQAALDRAVARVSRNGASLILGSTGSSRGYHLKGLGAVFVLAPRALPEEGHVFIVRGRAATNEARQLAHAGRAQETELRERELRAMEEQAEAFQREAERAQQQAERALEEIAQEVRVRLGPPPAAPASPVAPVAPVASASPAAPAPPPGPAPVLPPPPWRFWFEPQFPRDTRRPGQVIADVRSAVTEALEGQGPHLRILRPEELVVVAVDFVPGSPFVEPRAQRTLVVRVRKSELDDRAAGRIAPEELRRRIEYVEY